MLKTLHLANVLFCSLPNVGDESNQEFGSFFFFERASSLCIRILYILGAVIHNHRANKQFVNPGFNCLLYRQNASK